MRLSILPSSASGGVCVHGASHYLLNHQRCTRESSCGVALVSSTTPQAGSRGMTYAGAHAPLHTGLSGPFTFADAVLRSVLSIVARNAGSECPKPSYVDGCRRVGRAHAPVLVDIDDHLLLWKLSSLHSAPGRRGRSEARISVHEDRERDGRAREGSIHSGGWMYIYKIYGTHRAPRRRADQFFSVTMMMITAMRSTLITTHSRVRPALWWRSALMSSSFACCVRTAVATMLFSMSSVRFGGGARGRRQDASRSRSAGRPRRRAFDAPICPPC